MKSITHAICFAILMILFCTGISLAFLHISDTLYNFSITYFQLEASTGLSREFMLDHYHAIMRFLNPFSNAEFSLPVLPFSEDGAIHFEKCRVLFREVYILATCSLITLILLRKLLYRKTTLRLTALFTIILPMAFGIWFALDFDHAFILFHQIFFPNDYWMFDPNLDPIIRILPQNFFLLCGVLIASCWLIGALVLLLLSKICPITQAKNLTI